MLARIIPEPQEDFSGNLLARRRAPLESFGGIRFSRVEADSGEEFSGVRKVPARGFSFGKAGCVIWPLPDGGMEKL